MPIMLLPDADIYYESAGSGKPPLVFIHGFTCAHTDWDYQVRRFSNTNQVITGDLRGHGRSPAREKDAGIEDLARDTASLLTALDVRGAILIGHSMGCRVAVATFRQNPELAAGIILVDGSLLGQGDPATARQTTRNTIEKLGYPTYARNTFAGMFFGNYDPALKDRIIRRAVAMDPIFATNLRSSFAGWDAAEAEGVLSALKIPLLVIQSTGTNKLNERFSLKANDTTVWLDTVRRLVPSVRIEILPGHGHFIMLESPEATNELIASFASRFHND